MARNELLTSLDPNQINIRTFSEEHDAVRVKLIGSGIDSSLVAQSIKDGLTDALKSGLKLESNSIPNTEIKVISVPSIIKETVIERIEVPIITTQYKEIDKHHIIREYEKIEVPVYIPEIKFIDKPVIIKEIEIKEISLPKYINLLVIIQTLAILALVITQIFRR